MYTFSVIIDDEIITFNVFNDKIVATHGNNFGNLNTYIPKLTSMLGYVPDYVCVGHLHQHVEKTYGKTELIVNPSFSGVDSYAKNRTDSDPGSLCLHAGGLVLPVWNSQ